jgi:uncharacterized protein (TIGR02246 family)
MKAQRRLTIALLVTAPVIAGLTLTGCGSNTEHPDQATSTSSTTPENPAAADEAAVRGLLGKINEAWASGDADAYASFHTRDADLIDFRGVHAVGREAIVDLLQPAFDSVLKDSKVEARIVDLRFLSPTVAIFHTEGKIVPMGEDSIQTFVATKGPDGWLIAAFQNTRMEATG